MKSKIKNVGYNACNEHQGSLRRTVNSEVQCGCKRRTEFKIRAAIRTLSFHCRIGGDVDMVLQTLPAIDVTFSVALVALNEK